MHLLNTQTWELERIFDPRQVPQYAALSHCWGPDEVTFDDLRRRGEIPRKSGYQKLQRACQVARDWGLDWLWADTVCIDRSSSAELNEAVNSAYQWYQQSQVCLVYLCDFQSIELTADDVKEQLGRCMWMSRSWTLQELIAPRSVQFYDEMWSSIGSKEELLLHLADITGIDVAVLKDPECIDDFSVGTRMSWASYRTSRLVEDAAYSLAGLFKVSVQVLYGEGRRAFIRLQEKIMEATSDASLFAWQSNDNQQFRGLLAHDPSEFAHFSRWTLRGPLQLRGDVSKISGAFSIRELSGVKSEGRDIRDIVVAMHSENNEHVYGRCSTLIGLTFHQWKSHYVRCNPQRILQLPNWPIGLIKKMRIKRDLGERESSNIAGHVCLHARPQKLPAEALEGPDTPKRETTEEGLGLQDSTTLSQSSEAASSRAGQSSWDSYTHSTDLNTVGSGVGTPFTDNRIPVANHSNPSFINFPFANPYTGVGTRFASPEKIGQSTSHTDQSSLLSVIQDTSSACGDSGEDDMRLFADPPPEQPKLDQNHPFYSVKNALTDYSLEIFHQELSQDLGPTQSSGKRVQHGAHSSTNKRRKSSFDAHIKIIEPSKPENDDPVMVEYKAPMNPSFACPFYRHEPTKYRSCLARADLASIKDVKRHLWVQHRRPYFCSVCRRIFDSADERDTHVRRRSCSLSHEDEIEGITEDQMQQLAVKADPNQSPGEQWSAITRIVFPGLEERLLIPYPTGNVETLVCHLRKYWARRGEEVIAEFLESKNLRNYRVIQNEERNLQALYAVVLNQMVDKAVDHVGMAPTNMLPK